MKDTVLFPDNVAKYGVLNFASEKAELPEASATFRAVGYGHSASLWKAVVKAYMDIGYEGILSIENEDPILTGEAGVGKTAVVEGFALRIVAGDVPPQLRDVTLRTLDVGLMQAGASMKGEFEQRLRQVIEEVQASPKPIILFIDEAHTLIGAGGSAGTGWRSSPTRATKPCRRGTRPSGRRRRPTTC